MPCEGEGWHTSTVPEQSQADATKKAPFLVDNIGASHSNVRVLEVQVEWEDNLGERHLVNQQVLLKHTGVSQMDHKIFLW